jgi:DNA polymerase elongation subunit (family B)
LKYPKSHPLNFIAKILLNSLYGRFGMDDAFSEIKIFDNIKSCKEFIDKYSDEDILEIIELGEKFLIKYRFVNKNEQTMLYGNLETHNVSIAIASAITAYARIHMSQFKNNPDFNLYYSDTDSIYIDKPLPDNFISNTILGKMKLECILKDAIFLAPKVYYLETEDGKIVYKVKGLKHNVELTRYDFEQLLLKQSTLEKYQDK